LCIQENTNYENFTPGSPCWALWASGGSNGATGATGPTGPTGSGSDPLYINNIYVASNIYRGSNSNALRIAIPQIGQLTLVNEEDPGTPPTAGQSGSNVVNLPVPYVNSNYSISITDMTPDCNYRPAYVYSAETTANSYFTVYWRTNPANDIDGPTYEPYISWMTLGYFS
jgi:hypothetical protein